MFNGLWTVEFRSAELYGRGILVINNERILGGDMGYYYAGNCKINNNRIDATITVIKYDPNSVSIFGDIDHFELIIQGEINENNFTATGTIKNDTNKITVSGTKKEDL